MSLKIDKIKKTGATFTPHELARFLAGRIAFYYQKTGDKVSVMDPSCGDGVLLDEISNIYRNVNDITGFDTDELYLAEAKNMMLTKHKGVNMHFEQADFLLKAPDASSLFRGELYESNDIIIANPPYVRTQVLGAEKAQLIARQYHLSGRIDLYYPFLIAMTNCLKPGGILGVITSNRFLTTKSGMDIRKYLSTHYDIMEVIDLGDTKLFDAAVLPAIFIGRKKNKANEGKQLCQFASIYQYDGATNKKVLKSQSVYDIIGSQAAGVYKVGELKYIYKCGEMQLSPKAGDIWRMTDSAEDAWINSVNDGASFFIGDRFKVRVGIKSCADNVFLADWSKNNIEVEGDIMRPLISSENISQWHFDNLSAAKVLYPYKKDTKGKETIDLEKYPKAKAYLLTHYNQLAGRKYLMKANRDWFEMWVPQNPSYWQKPKVVFPDISIEPRFCYDESGAVVNGNCYWIVAQNEEERELLLLIEGVCNSQTMVRYHDLCFNNKLYSGRRRYLSQYIERYPIPNPRSEYAKRIVKVVEALNSSTAPNYNTSLKKKLDSLVALAFGV